MDDRLKTVLSTIGASLLLAGGTQAVRQVRRRRRYFPLEGRSVIVTGAARSFGQALGSVYAKSGAHVTLVDGDDEALRQAEKSVLPYANGECVAHVCDVHDRDDVRAAVDAIRDDFGSVDVLVNYAPLPSASPRKDFGLRTMLESYVHTTPYMTLEVAPRMIRRRAGRIVNVLPIDLSSSVTGLHENGIRTLTIQSVAREMRSLLQGQDVYLTLAMAGPFEERGREHDRQTGPLSRLIRTDEWTAAQKVLNASLYGDGLVVTSRAVQAVDAVFGMLPYSVKSSIEDVWTAWSERSSQDETLWSVDRPSMGATDGRRVPDPDKEDGTETTEGMDAAPVSSSS